MAARRTRSPGLASTSARGLAERASEELSEAATCAGRHCSSSRRPPLRCRQNADVPQMKTLAQHLDDLQYRMKIGGRKLRAGTGPACALRALRSRRRRAAEQAEAAQPSSPDVDHLALLFFAFLFMSSSLASLVRPASLAVTGPSRLALGRSFARSLPARSETAQGVPATVGSLNVRPRSEAARRS